METRLIWKELAVFSRHQYWAIVGIDATEKLKIKSVNSRPVRRGISDNDWTSRICIMFLKPLTTELRYTIHLC